MSQITPFLWFDKEAEEAANYYISVFPNSKITDMSRYDENSAKVSNMEPGTVLTIAFELNGQEFNALNGGPIFKFNESISFVIHCETQAEVDNYWGKLSAVPESEQCGWCKDKFGVSWQIVPNVLPKLLSDKDPEKSGRAMKAMLQMKKLDIVKLQAAFDGKE
jgi:predicted 3-demethylubiquinone-9 3-methyltransferase (glyoxalase superfamily)